MNQYRITKYNPSFRNDKGYYIVDEWTDFSDIGKKFNNIGLTLEDYIKVENAYIRTAVSILKECNIKALTIKNLELHLEKQYLQENQIMPIENIHIMLKDIFRNKLWCKFEMEDAFVHIGYDFYMYLGCNLLKKEAEQIAIENGLFCEEFTSPYLEL